MSIQSEGLTVKHRSAAHETVVQIEKLHIGARRAADAEGVTSWLARPAGCLYELTDKAQRATVAAAEAPMNAQDLHGEHLAEVVTSARRARDEICRIYFSLTP